MFYEEFTDNIKEYDLKRQMWENSALVVTKNCIIDVAQYCDLSEKKLEQIFGDDNNYSIEKYLLFRSELTRKYDCDKSKIVREFFKEKTKGLKVSYDTLFSFQYIWSIAIKDIKISNMPQDDIDKFQKKYGMKIPKNMFSFIMQLKEFNKIEKSLKKQDSELNIELYSSLQKLAHYYHTIGNMSPCITGKYNLAKGDYNNRFFDRMDLFYEWLEQYDDKSNRILFSLRGILSKEEIIQIKNWFNTGENIEKYNLEKIIKTNLPKFIPSSPVDLTKYINDILNIIDLRGNTLIKQ